jgi:hypothetical protein
VDALKYAPADAEWLCGVTLGGSVIHGDDKVVASEWTVVWMLNVRKALADKIGVNKDTVNAGRKLWQQELSAPMSIQTNGNGYHG